MLYLFINFYACLTVLKEKSSSKNCTEKHDVSGVIRQWGKKSFTIKDYKLLQQIGRESFCIVCSLQLNVSFLIRRTHFCSKLSTRDCCIKLMNAFYPQPLQGTGDVSPQCDCITIMWYSPSNKSNTIYLHIVQCMLQLMGGSGCVLFRLT